MTGIGGHVSRGAHQYADNMWFAQRIREAQERAAAKREVPPPYATAGSTRAPWWEPSADPIGDIIAAIKQARESLRVSYVRNAHMPEGAVYVMAPALTGHDRDVLVIPQGSDGDRVLATIRAAGREPVEWTPTPEEHVRGLRSLGGLGAVT